MSHREYLIWMERFKRQWNSPDRSDHYLMLIAAILLRSSKGLPDLGKMKIPFKFKSDAVNDQAGKMSVEEATAWAKARVHEMFGVDDRPLTMRPER